MIGPIDVFVWENAAQTKNTETTDALTALENAAAHVLQRAKTKQAKLHAQSTLDDIRAIAGEKGKAAADQFAAEQGLDSKAVNLP